MKTCHVCGTQVEDSAMFCGNCSANLGVGAQQQNQGGFQQPQQQPVYQQQPAYQQPVYDPYDHTAEFDPKDISDNKVISMLTYLLGTVGIIIALLAANNSPYASFHVRQSLKFVVITVLGAIVATLTCWLVLPTIAYSIFLVVLFVVKIICFFQICSGKAIEPYIIRNFKFLS